MNKPILLDMHNNPEFALDFIVKNPTLDINTTKESLAEFMSKTTDAQKKRWEKLKGKVRILD